MPVSSECIPRDSDFSEVAQKHGRAEGIAEGRAEGIAEIIKNLFEKGMSVEQISDLIGISKEEITKSLNTYY